MAVPVRLPDGTLSRAGVHAAAQRLSSVDCSADQRASAADKLRGLYHQLGEQAPDTLLASSTGRSHTTPDMEIRSTAGEPVELRSGGADSRTIGGYAALFGERSELLGNGFREVITSGFFNKSRGDGYPGVTARFEHNPMYVLGSTEAGTLRLNIDGRGLDYSVDLPKTRDDVLELVTRKDIRSSSFAFQAFSDDWGFDDGVAVRTLLSGRLIDVAPVSSPAYTKSSVSLRSLSRFMHCPVEDVERYAETGELRRLFTRSDNRGPLSGAQARSRIMRLRYPAPQQTGKQKVVDIEGKRWASKPLTSKQLQVEVLGRWQPMR